MAEAIINLGRRARPRSEPQPFLQSNRSLFGMDVPSAPSFTDDHAASFDLGFDIGENGDYNECFFGEEGYEVDDDDDGYVEESVNYVTDLYESRQPLVDADDVNWEVDYDENGEELAVHYHFGPGDGLRVVDINSVSDSEEFEVSSSILGRDDGNDNDNGDDHHDGAYIDGIFGINGYISDGDGDEVHFEWEEVSERFNLDDREALNSVIDQIHDISVISDAISSTEDVIVPELDEDEHVRNIEWEVLLAVNNIDRGFDFENPEDADENVNVVNVNRLPEDYVLAMEYDALFGQLVENANSQKGSPPASKRAVEGLQSFIWKMDGGAKNGCGGVISCAVCKDDVADGEKVTKMPCLHMYHGECILPWLKIRNTCPVCRFELPTEDADYENRRASRLVRGGGGVVDGGAASLGAGDFL